ncbi:MAG: tripartite tricarboxylate transporter substrate binding protein [Betaproteobacteria bacterium]|nr:tripartite tricarboxylate transporter substrate binding protein [Betaproteobacteria bacterium]
MILNRRTLVTIAIAALCATSAWSQTTYPTRPIKLLIGFAAGGPLDTYTRILAQDMSSALGQSVVVENRPGASGQIATDAVAQAEPDGYTLLSTASTFIVNPILLNKPKPDPLKDFVAVSHTAVLPTVLVVPQDSPVNSLQDLIKLARTSNVSYASAGTGGPAHLAGALLAHSTSTTMTHIPFRGAAPGLAEVMAGRISFTFYTMSGLKEYVAAKRVKPIAITAATRHPDFPNVPTMTEAGIKGFDDVGAWFGIVAPAGTPAAIVTRLNSAIDKSLARPEVRERLVGLGMLPVGGLPSVFKTFLEQDSVRWTALIKAADIKGE